MKNALLCGSVVKAIYYLLLLITLENKSERRNGMRLKTYLLAAMVLVLAMGIGCSGQSSSSGGGFTSTTLVGTWNLFSSTKGSWPQQITFVSDGTGSNSGGTLPSSSFTWTQQGSQVVITFPAGDTTTINNVVFLSGNSIILALPSGGGTATYNRA